TLLNKFIGNVEKNEEFVLSTTIQHVIGVRNGSDDKTILAGAVTDSMILSIFSPDEKTSKSGSKSLCDLIEENEIFGHSLMTTGFIQKVQHAFTNNQQSSSSSQTESTTPYHVKCGLLDIIHKLAATVDDLQPISILIPILIVLKTNEDKNIKKKSENIFIFLNSKGINAPSSESTKENDEKIQYLEEQNRIKDEETRRKDEQLQKELIEKSKETKRAEEAEEKVRIAEERARLAEERTRQADIQLRAAQDHVLLVAKQTTKPSQIPASLNSALQKMNVPQGDKGRVQGSSFVHSNERCNSTITMDPIINEGVARFEVVFNEHDGEKFSLIFKFGNCYCFASLQIE
ncbi:MAG: hypothetical protein EZS28_004735, partial [Streblomastix strix]